MRSGVALRTSQPDLVEFIQKGVCEAPHSIRTSWVAVRRSQPHFPVRTPTNKIGVLRVLLSGLSYPTNSIAEQVFHAYDALVLRCLESRKLLFFGCRN